MPAWRQRRAPTSAKAVREMSTRRHSMKVIAFSVKSIAYQKPSETKADGGVGDEGIVRRGSEIACAIHRKLCTDTYQVRY